MHLTKLRHTDDIRVLGVDQDVSSCPSGTGWTILPDRTPAIWDRGFPNFLAAPDELSAALWELKLHMSE